MQSGLAGRTPGKNFTGAKSAQGDPGGGKLEIDARQHTVAGFPVKAFAGYFYNSPLDGGARG
jgi:hypothetical protein